MSHSLLRPSSTGSVLLDDISHINAQTGDNTVLVIKAETIELQAAYQSINVSRETGNIGPSGSPAESFSVEKHLSTGRTSGKVKITGHVLRGQLIGFSSMPDDTVTLKMILGKTGTSVDGDDYHTLQMVLVITDIAIKYSRKNPTIPITIAGKITAPASGNVIQESIAGEVDSLAGSDP